MAKIQILLILPVPFEKVGKPSEPSMQNIDELLRQQRELILQMDQHHQKQVTVLQERLDRIEGQITSYNSMKQNLTLAQDGRSLRSEAVLAKTAPLSDHLPPLRQ